VCWHRISKRGGGKTKTEVNQTSPAKVAAKFARKPDEIRSLEIFPGGVGFETRSASGGRGAVLVANSTRPVLHGVSVLLIGNRLGLRPASRMTNR
jgi:hypothetical protein